HFCGAASPRVLFRYRSSIVLSDKTPDHLGGVIHHRDDPGIVEPGGADNPDRTDDLLAAVVVGCNYHRASGHPEEVALGANENLYALALLAGVEQAQHRLAGLEHLEEGA